MKRVSKKVLIKNRTDPMVQTGLRKQGEMMVRGTAVRER